MKTYVMKSWFPYLLLSPVYFLLGVVIYWGMHSYLSNPIGVSEYSIGETVIRNNMPTKLFKNAEGIVVLQPGDQIALISAPKRNEECNLVVTRILKSNNDSLSNFEYLLTTSVRHVTPSDKLTKIANPMQLPYNTIPGKYLLFSNIAISCNPFQVYFPKYILTESIQIIIEPSDRDGPFLIPRLDEIK